MAGAGDGDEMIPATEASVGCPDQGMGVGAQRLQADVEQAVAAGEGDALFGRALVRQGLTQQVQEQGEGVRIQGLQFGQPGRLAGREPLAGPFDLLMLLLQSCRQQPARVVARLNPGQCAAGRRLSVLPKPWVDAQWRCLGPRGAGRQLRGIVGCARIE